MLKNLDNIDWTLFLDTDIEEKFDSIKKKSERTKVR